jgi:hypothetical protein
MALKGLLAGAPTPGGARPPRSAEPADAVRRLTAGFVAKEACSLAAVVLAYVAAACSTLRPGRADRLGSQLLNRAQGLAPDVRPRRRRGPAAFRRLRHGRLRGARRPALQGPREPAATGSPAPSRSPPSPRSRPRSSRLPARCRSRLALIGLFCAGGDRPGRRDRRRPAPAGAARSARWRC